MGESLTAKSEYMNILKGLKKVGLRSGKISLDSRIKQEFFTSI
jgi:hypothetical protein